LISKRLSLAIPLLFPFFVQAACYVNSIQLVGNQKTKSEILEFELLVKIDSTYDCTVLTDFLIPQSRKQLVNLNLFNKVDVRYENDTVWVTVVEKWYFWPIPFLETADRNFNEWIRFNFDPDRTNYGLYLFLYNRRGRNETLKISLGQGYTQLASVEYLIPRFANSTWGGSMKVKWTSNAEVWSRTDHDTLVFYSNYQRQLIRQTEIAARVHKRLSPFEWIHLGGFYHQVNVNDVVVSDSINPDFLGGGSQLQAMALTGEYVYQQVDNRFFPMTGSEWSVYAESGITNREFAYMIKSSLLRHSHLIGRWYSTASMTFKQLSQADAYLLEKGLGYRDNLRGFERYVVDGDQTVLGKATLKFALIDNKTYFIRLMPVRGYKYAPTTVYLNAYSDIGRVRNTQAPGSNILTNQWLYSYGAGLAANMYYDKTLRVEYSINSLGQPGVYIHFDATL
jgi:hypothetical protein